MTRSDLDKSAIRRYCRSLPLLEDGTFERELNRSDC